MFILPFHHSTHTVSPTTHLSTFQFLVIGRSTLWSEEEMEIEADILHPNGIYLCDAPFRLGDTWLCPVDLERTHLDDFYRWEERAEADHDSFCWKTVYIMGSTPYQRDILSLPEETLGPHRLEELVDALCLESKRSPRFVS